ncbi:hypothetical protein Ciccas_004463 [Cichlidogyrus casuarinus]|uniref:Uncharacterized protein n=1 Tax=Cichlidogyrus casuarinus TaxID=1844966 RepID=A0ABD2QDR9_9PLAT
MSSSGSKDEYLILCIFESSIEDGNSQQGIINRQDNRCQSVYSTEQPPLIVTEPDRTFDFPTQLSANTYSDRQGLYNFPSTGIRIPSEYSEGLETNPAYYSWAQHLPAVNQEVARRCPNDHTSMPPPDFGYLEQACQSQMSSNVYTQVNPNLMTFG